MTEQEWLESRDPVAMLDCVRDWISDRKCSLVVAACARSVNAWRPHYVERLECDADREPAVLWWGDDPFRTAQHWAAGKSQGPDIIRDIVGNPFVVPPVLLPHGGSTDAERQVVNVAAQIYDERDFASMLVLRDSLMDAGCESLQALAHCLEPAHHRGCWLIDIILGKQ